MQISLWRELWRSFRTLVTSTILLPLFRSRLGTFSRRISMPAGRAPSQHGIAAQLQHGIDCACYFTDNFFVRSPIEGHFSYENAASFSTEHASLLESLAPPKRAELLSNLEAEAKRRHAVVDEAVSRKTRIRTEYVPTHAELWTLWPQLWLRREFIELVSKAQRGGPSFKPPPQLAPGVYSIPIFTENYCRMLCEELDAFRASGLPAGQPNSMNRYGTLLDELGMGPGFLEPLMRDWLSPLCKALPPLAAVGGASLDHHKSFVVAYRLGEDEELSAHFDNSEITLNCNLGRDFEEGELVFFGHKEGASAVPIAHHDWSEAGGVGHAVLHLGANVHAALPISSGERHNLVMWMRSSEHRRRAGCAMCGATDQLLLAPR